MLVRNISMEGFMSHHGTKVELPTSGLVLVTGPNGSGKSSLVEAVATAAFGKTLRGTSPWAGKGAVNLITEDLDINRSCTKGGSKSLKWEPIEGDTAPDFASPTKSQETLETYIGSFDVWRRTSVFSSQDASHFTMATDGQRKKLLETLIGLDRFDPALAACRADRRAAEAKLSEATKLLDQLESQLEAAHRSIKEAKRVLDTIPEPPDVSELREREVKLLRLCEAARVDVRKAERRLREFDRAGCEEAAAACILKRQLDNLGKGNCDRCGQPITEELRAPLVAESEKADAAAKAARDVVAAEADGIQEELVELREEVEEIRVKGKDVERYIQASDVNARQRQAAEQAHESACKGLKGLQDRISSGKTVVAEHAERLALLQAAELVLGLKGVRAHVLGRALAGIEQAANVWLNRIVGSGHEPCGSSDEAAAVEAVFDGALCLSLKPYSETKQGGVSDAISLEVLGAGGGYGYKASSGGERRRIDVALLLALAEVAQAAHGQAGGTIWADECFDALDADGVDRVSAVLAELAKDRAVVVISHNPQLQQALDPVLWLGVEHGKVRRLR